MSYCVITGGKETTILLSFILANKVAIINEKLRIILIFSVIYFHSITPSWKQHSNTAFSHKCSGKKALWVHKCWQDCNSSNCKCPAGGQKEQIHLREKCKWRLPLCRCHLKQQHTFKQGLMFATEQWWDAYSLRWQHSKGFVFSTAHRSSLDFLTPCIWNKPPVNGWAGWQLAPGQSTFHGLQHLPPIRKTSWDLHRKLTKRTNISGLQHTSVSLPPLPTQPLVVDQTNATLAAL